MPPCCELKVCLTPSTIIDLVHNYQLARESGESWFYIEGHKVTIKVEKRNDTNN